MPRFDHVGVIVDDLDAAIEFFVSLGFGLDGRMTVEGETVDRINGLDGVRAEVAMVYPGDGSGGLELIRYHAPADEETTGPAAPPNRHGYRHVAVEIEDLNGIVARLRAQGFDTVGEVQDYGDTWRLCYVRGPEGLIVELAEKLTA